MLSEQLPTLQSTYLAEGDVSTAAVQEVLQDAGLEIHGKEESLMAGLCVFTPLKLANPRCFPLLCHHPARPTPSICLGCGWVGCVALEGG